MIGFGDYLIRLAAEGSSGLSQLLTTMSESGLADYDERRWMALLEWLKGHGMMVDEDHLLVRPKHVPGTNSFHFPHLRTIKDQHNHWYYQAQGLVCLRSSTFPFVPECPPGCTRSTHDTRLIAVSLSAPHTTP